MNRVYLEPKEGGPEIEGAVLMNIIEPKPPVFSIERPNVGALIVSHQIQKGRTVIVPNMTSQDSERISYGEPTHEPPTETAPQDRPQQLEDIVHLL